MWRCVSRGLGVRSSRTSLSGSSFPRFFSTGFKTCDYTIVDHTYGAVVVGAGGGGLKVAIGLSEHGTSMILSKAVTGLERREKVNAGMILLPERVRGCDKDMGFILREG
ncbi:unnamed protein product [Eruca vesicaria subsp. sativa]|uniref:Uncharacterized protein n=1 Tax=Eruca vesicaria subsp. sativa TaxID=29727 RepID=A0ABC8JV49_ERUVS|nr:unnamed protein product [Eruca vesicaria subsp. sativa]